MANPVIGLSSRGIRCFAELNPSPDASYVRAVSEHEIATMTDLALKAATAADARAGAWAMLTTNRNWLGVWFMLPAAGFLILFLAYPLALGIWISFTDARIGQSGAFIGLENYEWLSDDSVFWLSVFNTLLYTSVASVVKFAIGL